jgi:hypothetical protein
MIVEVFIAQRNPGNPLAHHRLHAMLHQILVPVIGKAARHTSAQIKNPVNLPQQQSPGIRGQLTAVKRRDHTPTFTAFKFQHV